MSKILIDEATVKLALKALEWNMCYLPSHGSDTATATNAVTALRETLAQQEPLTDDEILAANYPDGEENGPTIAAPDYELICFAKQIEAKLKEKNT